ncbi:hypothetical protein SDC9_201407 [bioreactor metagenome]|uniref:Uncharacterized protein n=1 Tax=bioreactor metagenome TaxID=1076179 RepID=A0A645IQW1_9ZZZZ
MEPRLGDDHQPVEFRPADFIQRGIAVTRMNFVRHERIVEKLFDLFRLAVAQGDAVHQRMRFEKSGELAAELPQSHQAESDTHTIFLCVE